MPMILQKPPTSSALTPYSVSPRRKDHNVGPKPTKNRVTFMPNFLAVRKCPNSCTMIEKHRTSRKITQPSRPTLSPSSSDVQLPRPPTGPVIDGEHLGDRRHRRTRTVMLRDYPCHGVNNPREADPSRQEVGHTCLIRGVVYGRGGPAGRSGEPRQRHRGER